MLCSDCENTHTQGIHETLMILIVQDLVLSRSWAVPELLRRLPVQSRIWECRLRYTGACASLPVVTALYAVSQ